MWESRESFPRGCGTSATADSASSFCTPSRQRKKSKWTRIRGARSTRCTPADLARVVHFQRVAANRYRAGISFTQVGYQRLDALRPKQAVRRTHHEVSRPAFSFLRYSISGPKYSSIARVLTSSPVFSRITSRQSLVAPSSSSPRRNFPTSLLPK